jgi:ESS family glutamate:Na+ symporter
VAAVVNLVIQDLVGVGLMAAMGLPPVAGLLAGSAALSGGHGTVLAWAPIVARDFDMPSAAGLGAAAATFGPTTRRSPRPATSVWRWAPRRPPSRS